MGNEDLELGDTTQRLHNEVGHEDMIKGSVVQRLLSHVKKEESYINRLPPSIYMVSPILRDISPGSFNPRVVSIGPLHREDNKLQAFEGQKARYLINLMLRTKYPQEEILKLCVEKVYDSMEIIKACYVWTKTYDDAEIVGMMIMDASFILEFLFNMSISTEDQLCEQLGALLFQNVLTDLILLENQIPIFILDEIFKCTILKFNHNISLLELIYPLLDAINVFEVEIAINNICINNTHHILSLLHQCYKPPDNITKDVVPWTSPSISDLDRAGVNFKPNKNPTWLMGLEVDLYRFPCFFGSWNKPTLKIPVLKVFDSTELVFRNLIAYEQLGPDGAYVTSYAAAMDMLVNTEKDVAKLVDCRVLFNYMSSNEELANIINNISKEVVTMDFFYEDQWKKLSEYYGSYWPKNIAKMKMIYFSSPWNMIALLAGIILFALTVVQTIFTIKPT